MQSVLQLDDRTVSDLVDRAAAEGDRGGTDAFAAWSSTPSPPAPWSDPDSAAHPYCSRRSGMAIQEVAVCALADERYLNETAIQEATS